MSHNQNGTADATPAPGPEASRSPSSAVQTVVGVGASAGALATLRTLFGHFSADTGPAFVVVVHLSPDHESHLASLLQPHVRMPVVQVVETTQIKPGHVYVIPPGRNLSAVDTHLRLSDLEARRRERAPIDHFFRTLARTHDGHAVGVVLTGTGSEGALGLREIREQGGMTIVQDPAEATHDGMPRSALLAGAVDRVLPLAQIPEAIAGFAATDPHLPLTGGGDVDEPTHALLQRILDQIRDRTGRDFSRYARSTILRRLRRRLQLAHLEALDAYLDLLEKHPAEVDALADDLLVTVTRFFRDPAVFEALERHVIPELFRERGRGEVIRAWSIGCATGEEAYSLAMVLIEAAERSEAPPTIQIFASDLHERALDHAREGLYPEDIQTDVSPRRLQRFFTREDGGYRIRKEVRESVVFTAHDLLRDPPFGRQDLISCRNLLMDLQRDLQTEVAEVLHWSLRTEGFILLGPSESLDPTPLFRPVHKEHGLYRKRAARAAEPRLPVFASGRSHPAAREDAGSEQPWGELHHRAVERYGPPSLLLGPDDTVLHLSEHAGRYLALKGGRVTSDVYGLVRAELRAELRVTLHMARSRHAHVRSAPIRIERDGETEQVRLDARPAPATLGDGSILLMFDSDPADPGSEGVAQDGLGRPAEEMAAELSLTRRRLQAVLEEYETSQEEMRGANEEMQSSNEELRATMQELEISKEELQSMNEELQTLNQENRLKVDELVRLSVDLHNLLAATEIATLFLDRDLRILRFTPRVTDLFNVRLPDRGRALSDLSNRIPGASILEDAQQVLDSLVPIEREVEDEAGRWYLTRVLPYRGADNRIEGAVITFVEITNRKRAEEALRVRAAADHVRTVLADTLRPLTQPTHVARAAARILGEHLGASRVHYADFVSGGTCLDVVADYHADVSSAVGRHRLSDSGPLGAAEFRAGRTLVISDVETDPRLDEKERAAVRAFGGVRAYVVVPLIQGGRPVAVFAVHHERPHAWASDELSLIEEVAERTWAAVERTRAEGAVRGSEERYRTLFESIDEAFALCEIITDDDGRPVDYRLIEVNPAFEAITGFSPEQTVGRTARELVPDLETEWFEQYGRVALEGETVRFERAVGALQRWYDVYAFPRGEGRFALLFKDITERRRTQAALREGEARYRLLVESATEYAIFLMDLEGRITSWNPGAERIFGYSADEAIGRSAALIFTPEDRASGQPDEELERARRTGRASDERWHARRDGSRFWASGVLEALRDGERLRGFAKVLRDNTERKRAQEELERANATLAERVAARTGEVRALAERLTVAAQEERHRLARVLHDDLQQQLYGLTATLDMTADADEAGRARLLARARSLLLGCTTLARSLAHDLSPPILAETRVATLVGGIVDQKREQHGLQTEVVVDPEVAISSRPARELLYQALNELLFNIVKHARTRTARIEIDVRDHVLVARIADDGVGFVHDPEAPSAAAAGLGLRTVAERLELIGGGLEVSTAPGQGTRVTLRIPLSTSSSDRPDREEP